MRLKQQGTSASETDTIRLKQTPSDGGLKKDGKYFKNNAFLAVAIVVRYCTVKKQNEAKMLHFLQSDQFKTMNNIDFSWC